MNTSPQKTTHIRVFKNSPRRIGLIGKKLSRLNGGSWSQPDVVQKALQLLEEKLLNPETIHPTY